MDIDLDDPVIADDAYALRISGEVRRAASLTLDDLTALPALEQLVTLQCISNPVGGPLVGTSRWTGVRLGDLMSLVSPTTDARWLEVRAADGYSETFPLDVARDPQLIAAYGMNGFVLPRSHGFPVRLLVPGRYGVKNVKWVRELVLRSDEVPGYWVARGWDRRALVRAASRIDVPRNHQTVASPVLVAGVAWTGSARVSAVEVTTDESGLWIPAQIEGELAPLAWRRWFARVPVADGPHAIAVRCRDGAGRVQTADRRAPHPSGATGYHRIVVTVS